MVFTQIPMIVQYSIDVSMRQSIHTNALTVYFTILKFKTVIGQRTQTANKTMLYYLREFNSSEDGQKLSLFRRICDFPNLLFP